MTQDEPRHHEANRSYAGDGIVVHWEPALCIHTANCVRNLPEVFDAMARPWINVTNANADAIAAAIQTCPTGALRYERTDDALQEQATEPTRITPRPNGPLFVRGAIQIVDGEGNVIRTVTRAALCRCGCSGNKPFCDNSHRLINFTT